MSSVKPLPNSGKGGNQTNPSGRFTRVIGGIKSIFGN